MKSLTTLAVIVAASTAIIGCNKQGQVNTDRQTERTSSGTGEKREIRKSASNAKDQIDAQAKAEKERIDAEAKAAQARIDAERAQANAQAKENRSSIEAERQNIQEAAGAATSKIKAEGQTSETSTTTTRTSDADQRLVQQVETALGGGTDANAEGGRNIQVTASGGTVTLKGAVKSDAEKTRVESAAKSVPGVTRVDNQIEVKP
jgi:osmotically-inducible protein OsmY